MPTLPAIEMCLQRNIGQHDAAKYGLSAILGLSADADNKGLMMHVSVATCPLDAVQERPRF